MILAATLHGNDRAFRRSTRNCIPGEIRFNLGLFFLFHSRMAREERV